MANFLDEWANHGFIILPVVDGHSPNAKQASVDHISKREKSRRKATEKMRELRALNVSLAHDSLTAEEREGFMAARLKLVKAVRSAETSAVNTMPKDYK